MPRHKALSVTILDIQAYRPTVVFINGEYWGIKNLRERIDQHYIGRRFGVDPDNIDLLTRDNEVKEGDNEHYNQMIEFVSGNDMGVESNYRQVLEMMDVDNYLDYYSAQVYYANTDWPANNIDFWRLRLNMTRLPRKVMTADGDGSCMMLTGRWDCFRIIPTIII
jgi:hypothetical protein